MRLVLACTVLCLLPVAPARAGQLVVGAAEDDGKAADMVTAKEKMDLARLAGLRAVRLSTIWTRGTTELTGGELEQLQNATSAAVLAGIRPIVSIYQFSGNTPLTATARAEFVSYAVSVVEALPAVHDVIIGNEPNLNLFWMPQFTRYGADAAAGGYLGLLALAYDALKQVDPTLNVIGGALAPRGQDRASAKRQTHSPTTFILDLGRAYRKSGRDRPVMDMFAFHPYGDHSSQPPDFPHPLSTTIGIADYDKLVLLLGGAFDGTAQAGSTLPIIYDEYGLDSRIPTAKRALYWGAEPRTTKPVPEAVQGRRYAQAIRMVSCQPNVELMLLFHVSDEVGLAQWQSGVYYADDSPKSSLPMVEASADSAEAGTLSCPPSRPAKAQPVRAAPHDRPDKGRPTRFDPAGRR